MKSLPFAPFAAFVRSRYLLKLTLLVWFSPTAVLTAQLCWKGEQIVVPRGRGDFQVVDSRWNWKYETQDESILLSEPFDFDLEWGYPTIIAWYALAPGTNVSFWTTNLVEWHRWHEFLKPDDGQQWLIGFPAYQWPASAFFFLTNETGSQPIRTNDPLK